jgi:TetR/AcrR family transcriptional regulator, regulator of biofilm formation and stress response
LVVVSDDRAQRRRTAILEAALRLIGREGRQALTHRAVAAEAGVPLGATTYYFSSRDDLLAQALRHVADQGIHNFQDMRNELLEAESPKALAGQLLDNVVVAAKDRTAFIAEYELWLEAGRNAELRGPAVEWCEAEQSVVAEALERLGSSDPSLDASIVVGVLDGLGERVIARDDPERAARELAPEVERLLERLIPS